MFFKYFNELKKMFLFKLLIHHKWKNSFAVNLKQTRIVFCLNRLRVLFEMPANGLLITRSNIHQLTSDDILSFNSKEHWHKFILENGGLFDKEAVLQAVLQSISPFDLVPVKYSVEGNDSHFLARNCGQAIEKFCLNLLLPIQLKDQPGEVTMSIQTCSISIDQYQMNMQSHLKKAIERRYDENHKGFINLSSFHKEPELYEVLFCPLSKPRFLAYVLSILKRILKITAIDLSSNDIEELKALEILCEFKELVSVDLSNNKIKDPDLSELLKKTVPTLQELNLRGNPVCSVFLTEMEYLNWIRDKNHFIRKLDGICINNGLPNHQVYLCSEKAGGIVNEFLMHYFTLYDDNRQALEHSYNKKAMFSMTCTHPESQNLKDSKLECYHNHSKNLLNAKNKDSGVCHTKSQNIIKILCKLPLTEHDRYSFKVDVLFFEEQFIIITVSGIFKDFQETTTILSFNRTFALKRIGSEEFVITNDLFHVASASVDEINAFRHSEPASGKSQPVVTKEEERNEVNIVSKETGMNSAYSRRCLEDCGWDVKKALNVFLENYEISKIPPEAFIEPPT